jgi:hypothetical protein
MVKKPVGHAKVEIREKASCAILGLKLIHGTWGAVAEFLGFSEGYLWRVSKGLRRPSLRLCRKLGILPPPKRRPNWHRKHTLLARWVRDYRRGIRSEKVRNEDTK